MAEFRKREDINQEIDILQTWSEMGAPRMDDVSRNLDDLVHSVESGTAGEGPAKDFGRRTLPPGQPPGRVGGRSDRPPVPPMRPDFADLPPGDDERPIRPWLRAVVALTIVGIGAAIVMSRTDLSPAPHGTKLPPPGSPGEEPTPTPAKTGAPTAAPTAHATATPMARPTAAAVPTGLPTAHETEQPATAAPKGATTAPKPWARHHVTPPPQPAATPRVRSVGRPKPTEYVVRAGDSLSLIAMQRLGQMERWPEIQALNSRAVPDADVIHPGAKLRLPGDEQAAPGATARVHVVRPGETLKQIAVVRLGDAARWTEIQSLNADRLAGTALPPGLKLVLPPDAVAPTGGAGRPGPAIASHAGTFHYVVRHGDSLALLARRYLGSADRWPEIYYRNTHKVANPNWLFPGQILSIPRAARHVAARRYVVKAGDTLWAIAAAHFGDPVRWPAIYGANRSHIRDPHWIYPNQVFTLPGT